MLHFKLEKIDSVICKCSKCNKLHTIDKSHLEELSGQNFRLINSHFTCTCGNEYKEINNTPEPLMGINQSTKSFIDTWLVVAFIAGLFLDLFTIISDSFVDVLFNFHTYTLRWDHWGFFFICWLLLMPPILLGIGYLIGLVHNKIYFKFSKGNMENDIAKDNTDVYVKLIGVSISVCFLIIFIAAINSNVEKQRNKTPLEKFYDQHPDAYFRDMKEQQQIQEIKDRVQEELDRQKAMGY